MNDATIIEPKGFNEVSLLNLKSYTQADVLWNNAVSQCSSTVSYQFGDTPFNFSIQLEGNGLQAQDIHCIELKAGESFFWMILDKWPESLATQYVTQLDLLQSPSNAIKSMAAENILTPVIEWIEQTFDLILSVVNYSTTRPNLIIQRSLLFSYQEEGDSVLNGQIFLNHNLSATLPLQLRFWPPLKNDSLDLLRLSTNLVFGSTIMTVAELNTVEIGDVVFLDRNIYSGIHHMWAHFAPNTLITLKKELKIMADLEPTNDNETASVIDSENMTNVSVEAVTAGEIPTQRIPEKTVDLSSTEKIAIDNLEIKLDFDLGSISLTVAQIKQISPGNIFSIGRPLKNAVNISSHGQLLARGELVDIDGIVGVRVKELYTKDNG